VFKNSDKLKCSYNDFIGHAPPSYSATRWWSKNEVAVEIHVHFDSIVKWSSQHLKVKSVEKLHRRLSDAAEQARLKVELAVCRDFLALYACQTYLLEGNRFLIHTVWEKIEALRFSTATFLSRPHPEGLVAAAIADATSSIQQADEKTRLQLELHTHAKSCVKPLSEYFDTTLHQHFTVFLEVAAAARFIKPSNVMADTKESDLKGFRHITSIDINALFREFATYRLLAMACRDSIPMQEFWCKNRCKLPEWHKLAVILAGLPPSSAAVERLFSFMQAYVTDQQNRMSET